MNKYLEENQEIEDFLSRKTDAISQETRYLPDEIFTRDFMLWCTCGRYADIHSFLKDAGFVDMQAANDADEASSVRLNAFVASATDFVSWCKMCEATMNNHMHLLGRF